MFTFIEISRRRSHLPSRAFIRLLTLQYRRQSKADNGSVKVQSVLCEDAVFEENNRGLKIFALNICLTIVIVYAKAVNIGKQMK